ncbi:MAG TPA: helix-turn-helix transcriptional regulator [Xanthobacteraceae bacterium]
MADLRIALAAASRGLAVAPLRMIESVRHDAAAPFDATGVTDSIGLTSRELEVLGLLSEGASNKEIARRLAISVHTAKFHVASILEKLDATGRTDAVAHAVRLGLLML